MDTLFFCYDCGSEHDDPADGRLGHLVICLDCAMIVAVAAELFDLIPDVVAADASNESPLAA